MADEALLHKVHQLGDLDLAALLCLVNRQHCIVSTDPDALDDLVAELQLVASDAFGLTSAVVHCSPRTTLADLATALLVPVTAETTTGKHADAWAEAGLADDSYFANHRTGQARQIGSHAAKIHPSTPSQQHGIANVILAQNLDRAPKAVQIQCLELLRTRRIFTNTSVQTAPKTFLFVAVLGADSGGSARLTPHLNDYFYIAHWHDLEDGFPRLEDEEGIGYEQGSVATEDDDDDNAESFVTSASDSNSLVSDSSVVRRPDTARSRRSKTMESNNNNNNNNNKYTMHHSQPPFSSSSPQPPLFETHEIAALSALASSVSVDIEILRYQMNIISFLRMHRAVAGGIHPQATQHLDQLVRSLAALHGLEYATPAIVALAARKVYLHRIRIVAPRDERSMQWGSDLAAVKVLLDGVGPEEVIEDVLAMVSPPV